MWHRFAQALLVWISLIGLVPAVLACSQTMPERDCCPPGQSMPCEAEPASGNVEAAACCATSSLAPSIVQVASEQHGIDLPALDISPAGAYSPLLPSSSPRRYLKLSADPPELVPDRSCTYLQTARLRL